MPNKREGKIVYSTDPDFRLCDECGQYPCECKVQSFPPPEKQTARIRRERRRKGKVVTAIGGLELSPDDFGALTKTLKSTCGAGGTAKDGAIEIQGDHRDKVANKLKALGFKVKMAGA